MKTVLTYGTFDLFHFGHLRLLERARALGDRLVVGVSTEGFCAIKGKVPVCSYEERAAIVGALECVHAVIREERWEQKARDIDQWSAQLVVMGSDWAGKLDDIPGMLYLPRTPGVSSSSRRTSIDAPGPTL